jgi:hypothetical protein
LALAVAAPQNPFWTKIALESWVSGRLSNPGLVGFRRRMGRYRIWGTMPPRAGSSKRRILAQ